MNRPLLLASTSAYRRQLLARLGLPFDAVAPQVDEARLPAEAPEALARRLARAKAIEVARRHSGAVVIGSDQVAALDDEVLGKPGDAPTAIRQLQASSGRRVTFLTAVAVCDGASGRCLEHLDRTVVEFRTLAADEIARYVARESPLDCAGSFKSEALGIALFDAVDSRDPTALVGLPLIATAALLRELGYKII